MLLIGGGISDADGNPLTVPNADIYDPISDSWSAAANMSAGGVVPSALVIADGRVLVSGGTNSPACPAAIQVYEPAVNTWSNAADSGTSNGVLFLLPTGQVLMIASTCDGSELVSMIYDTTTDTWVSAASPAGHFGASITMQNGDVLIAGSTIGAPQHEGVAQYRQEEDNWRLLHPMHQPRYSFKLATLTDGRILAVGSAALTEAFDPSNNTWTLGNTYTHCGDSDATVTALGNGSAFAIGGYLVHGASALFEADTTHWRSVPAIPDGERFSHTAVRLDDDSVLVLAGLVGGQPGNCPTCNILTPAYTNWRLHAH